MRVRWIETESSSWKSVSHKIYPQQLNRIKSVRDAEEGRQENADDLADVGRYHITNKALERSF